MDRREGLIDVDFFNLSVTQVGYKVEYLFRPTYNFILVPTFQILHYCFLHAFQQLDLLFVGLVLTQYRR